jgi:hypothetical protein
MDTDATGRRRINTKRQGPVGGEKSFARSPERFRIRIRII